MTKEEDIVKSISKEEAREIILDEVRDLGYKEGLEKAWEVARRIILSEKDGGLSMDKCQELFGPSSLYGIFKHDMSVYDVIEALDKYDAQNEIHVGDEVKIIGTDVSGVVTQVTLDNFVRGVCVGGSLFATKSEKLEKTGNHFPEVGKLLEALRGGKE